MEINKRENIGWIDLLRVTACFLVDSPIAVTLLWHVLTQTVLLFCKGAHWEVPYAVACPCL